LRVLFFLPEFESRRDCIRNFFCRGFFSYTLKYKNKKEWGMNGFLTTMSSWLVPVVASRQAFEHPENISKHTRQARSTASGILTERSAMSRESAATTCPHSHQASENIVNRIVIHDTFHAGYPNAAIASTPSHACRSRDIYSQPSFLPLLFLLPTSRGPSGLRSLRVARPSFYVLRCPAL